MSDPSPNTQAILLLSAPLIVDGKRREAPILSPGEYRSLAARLRHLGAEPQDLLASRTDGLVDACGDTVDSRRLRTLLGRGFLLAQAVERWAKRAIWVISRADDNYPKRLKQRLKHDSPAVLYGCGQRSLLEAQGLAIVGSRDVDEPLLEYSRCVASQAAAADLAVISGGARGVDRAAMNGALESGGVVAGVLAGDLERAVVHREHRDLLMDGRLALVSPFDPGARFNVGHAMQRNKTIYALADAALIVDATVDGGGTWAGAVEQLRKYPTPVYVRSTGAPSAGLDALREKGAMPWPNPDRDQLPAILAVPETSRQPAQRDLFDG
ncbi:MAG: DNA-processing protein DprA [Gammaproteobacteria bacterium]|nr:DNA-processing protein DprA [Gammaproteobacteria bacterium]MXY56941.1 DNA-processing protein DprA [Gammaproteobacteria bacterium]MYK45673.1 DNA-processing protein DprA [Gammaproteobacteria bacterium]